MLVGQRRWCCESLNKESIVVYTESYDRPRGILNRLGFRMMGKTKQYEIWVKYLQNIVIQLQNQYGGTGGQLAATVEEANRPDNWKVRYPYPGKEVL
jgi:hypothetical protein